MNQPMLQSEPNELPVPGELPVVDEITEESCPEMYAELCNGKGDDEDE